MLPMVARGGAGGGPAGGVGPPSAPKWKGSKEINKAKMKWTVINSEFELRAASKDQGRRGNDNIPSNLW